MTFQPSRVQWGATRGIEYLRNHVSGAECDFMERETGLEPATVEHFSRPATTIFPESWPAV